MTKRPRAYLSLVVCLALAGLLVATAPAAADFGDRALKVGMDGRDVRKLQSILTELGFDTRVTGTFGRGTERSVKRYERSEDLRVNGVVSRGQAADMKAAAKGAPEPEPAPKVYAYGERTMSRGDGGDDVAKLQRFLNELGLATPSGGNFGRATQGSVKTDEENEGQRVNGRVGSNQAEDIRRRARAGTATEGGSTGEDGASHSFPIRGPHSYGTSANRFGAPRSGHRHQGQDVLAATGTTLVAVHDGKVTAKQYQAGGAGNYLVIRGDEGLDSVYMHLRRPATVDKGDRVESGQRIGEVGCTGSCSGSHLHFELWTPHWFDGGKAFDPLPKLKRWDEDS